MKTQTQATTAESLTPLNNSELQDTWSGQAYVDLHMYTVRSQPVTIIYTCTQMRKRQNYQINLLTWVS